MLEKKTVKQFVVWNPMSLALFGALYFCTQRRAEIFSLLSQFTTTKIRNKSKSLLKEVEGVLLSFVILYSVQNTIPFPVAIRSLVWKNVKVKYNKESELSYIHNHNVSFCSKMSNK